MGTGGEGRLHHGHFVGRPRPERGNHAKEGSAMSEVIQALLKCERVSFEPEDVAKLVAGFEIGSNRAWPQGSQRPGDDSGR